VGRVHIKKLSALLSKSPHPHTVCAITLFCVFAAGASKRACFLPALSCPSPALRAPQASVRARAREREIARKNNTHKYKDSERGREWQRRVSECGRAEWRIEARQPCIPTALPQPCHSPACPASLYSGLASMTRDVPRAGGRVGELRARVCVRVREHVRVLVRARARVRVVLCVGGPPDGSLLLVQCRWRRLALAPCSLQQLRAGLAEAGNWISCDRNLRNPYWRSTERCRSNLVAKCCQVVVLCCVVTVRLCCDRSLVL